MDPALEPVFGLALEHAHRQVCDRGAGVVAAGVVRLDEVEGLAPGAAHELPQERCVFGHEMLVGVEVDDPVAGRVLERAVARIREGAVPGEVHDPGAERPGDLDRGVGRAGVDDHHLVDGARDRLEAAGEHLLLVLHDHHERERLALDRLGAPGERRALGAERPRPRTEAAGERRRGVAPAAARGLAVGGDVVELGVEALGGGEEGAGGRDLADLVEDDAGVVQEHWLVRVLPEGVEQVLRDDEEELDPLVGTHRLGRGERELGELAANLVGALVVRPLVKLPEERAEGFEVALAGGPARPGRWWSRPACASRHG